jgi:hypothetical protein
MQGRPTRLNDRGDEIMQTSGNNVVMVANRYRNYAILLVAFGFLAAFLYVFNYTSLFGGGLQ